MAIHSPNTDTSVWRRYVKDRLDTTDAANNPAGSMIGVFGTSVPTGFLECDGSAVSRTTYADLYSAIGTLYGTGDGSTSFNLPDLRGQFIRGFDNGAGTDPDAGSRTAIGSGSAGDNMGTSQTDQYASHNHNGWDRAKYATSTGTANCRSNLSGATVRTNTNAASGGNETRPTNINLMICVAY